MSQQSKTKELSVRAIVIGIIGSVIITLSSIYVALKMGALPWPIIFAAIISFVALKMLGNTNLSEVNVAHTAMSAGAMVAGGVAFTIPGLWILNPDAQISIQSVLIATTLGVVLGLIFSALGHRHFIKEIDIPYPMGKATAKTLTTTEAGGKEAGVLAGSMGFAGIISFLRDSVGAIPAVLFGNAQFLGAPLAISLSPMMMSVGFMAGTTAMVVWLLGGVIGHIGIGSLFVQMGIFTPEVAEAIRSSLGIGLMVGSGLGVLIKAFLPAFKGLKNTGSSLQSKSFISLKWMPIAIAVVFFVLTFALNLGVIASIICILGSWLAVTMAAQSVGETSIDPMEIFAVLVLMIARVFTDIAGVEAFLLCCVVAVACGLAGDVMSDFKAGEIIGTDPKAQWWGEVAGATIGIVVAVSVLFLFAKVYGTTAFGPDKEFVAVQASVVATLIGGSPHLAALLTGTIIGVILVLFGLPVITLGLGVYLPLILTLTATIGLVVKLVVTKLIPEQTEKYGLIIASGLLGGEAIVGVLIALGILFSLIL